MADFSGVQAKLDRSKQHVSELSTALAAFHESNPYTVIEEDKPETGQRVAKIGGPLPSIPAAIPLSTGDTVHNLRSALDHFMHAAVVAPTRNTMFPIFRDPGVKTAQQVLALVDGKAKGVSSRLRQALVNLEPYEGGNSEYLWAVNYLDNVDKHRLLLTVGTAHTLLSFDMAGFFQAMELDWLPSDLSMPIGLRPSDRLFVEEGTELFLAPTSEFHKHRDLKFTFEVALGEPQILEGEPVVPTLTRLVDEVERLIQRLIPLV